MYLHRSYSSMEMLSENTQIGAREPLYYTALGKAYLAFQEEYTLEELYPGELEAYSQRTITTIPKLKGYLGLIREDWLCGG